MQDTNSLFSSLILDLGSGIVKAGFSGEDLPAIQFDSYIGRPKFKKLLGQEEKTEVVGPNRELRGLFKLVRPVVRGSINEPEAKLIFSRIWDELKLGSRPVPVFLTEPPFTPLKQKSALAAHLFEKRSAEHVFFGTQGALSLYAFGKTDGLMLESGEGVTQVVPIYNGYKLEHAVERINFAGEDVSSHLRTLLRRNGNNIAASNESCLFDEMKKAVVELLPNEFESEVKTDLKRKGEEVKYELPDGDQIPIRSEKFQAAEILFNPSICGAEYLGLHELIEQSVRKLDLDLRKNMYKNIFISGGNTMIAGFPERLGNELAPLVFEKTPVSIIAANVDRTLLAWQGGSAVSQLTSFQSLWITKKEFAENGERIFLNKTF